MNKERYTKAVEGEASLRSEQETNGLPEAVIETMVTAYRNTIGSDYHFARLCDDMKDDGAGEWLQYF